MNIFHKIVYKTIIPVNIPDYLTLYSGDSRLRRTHLDNLLFVSNIASTTASIKNLNKSFFFRTHTLWNSLPFDIRNSMRLSQFKIKQTTHFWSIALSDNELYAQDTFARATHSAGRPSSARDDRVSCIQDNKQPEHIVLWLLVVIPVIR